MVDKPGRRKRRGPSRGKVAAIVVVGIVAVAVAWYVYASYFVRPPVVHVRIDTTYGQIDVELYPTLAPKTVANFISLANSGFYAHLVWHRIVNAPEFGVIQTGDPLTRDGGGNRSLWGTGGSNSTVPLEVGPDLHNYAGYLGMARSAGINSGSSQFYVNLTDNTSLDGGYTVFGKVTSGMDVVDRIAGVQTNSSDQPVTPVYVTDIVVLDSN